MLPRYRTECLNCDSLIDLHCSWYNNVFGDVMNKSLQIPSMVVKVFHSQARILLVSHTVLMYLVEEGGSQSFLHSSLSNLVSILTQLPLSI